MHGHSDKCGVLGDAAGSITPGAPWLPGFYGQMESRLPVAIEVFVGLNKETGYARLLDIVLARLCIIYFRVVHVAFLVVGGA